MSLRKLNFKWLLIVMAVQVSACSKQDKHTTQAAYIDRQDTALLSKPYNEVCFLMTHNSMNNTEEGFVTPNQTWSVADQLRHGVRGLMLDTYDGSNGIALTYHVTSALGSSKLVDVMQEIKDFMTTNKYAVISIIYQNEGGNPQLQKAIDSIGLNDWTYIYTGGSWPTLQYLVDNNKRLVLFVEQNKLPRSDYLMYAWGTVFDTPYTFHSTSDFNCDPNRGGSGSKQLFLINHWLSNFIGLPDISLAPQANNHAVISQRVQECTAAQSHFLNYLGMDFADIGDAKAVVDSINGF